MLISQYIFYFLEQPACEIFTKHHKRLSYSIQTDPIAIATLLNAEGIIDNATLNKIQTLEDMGTVFLLQEMEKAIYKSYLNLKKFAIILTKFKDTDLVGKSILKAYGNYIFHHSKCKLLLIQEKRPLLMITMKLQKPMTIYKLLFQEIMSLSLRKCVLTGQQQ